MLQFYKSIFICLILVLINGCVPDSTPHIDTMDEAVTEEDAFYADYDPSDMKFGYINTAGQLAIRDLYDGVREFSEGLAAANLNGKWGYIDQFGRTIVDHEFRSAFAFTEGIARVQDFEKQYWFIDKSGKRLNSQGFTEAYDCINGRIRVITESGYNYISLEGDTLLPAYCSGAKDFKNGLAVVSRFGKYGVIDPSGAKILPFSFQKIYVDDTVIRASDVNGVSLYSYSGKSLSDDNFDQITQFQNNKAVAHRNGKLIMISNTGEILFPLTKEIKRAEPAGSNIWRIYVNDGVKLLSSDGQMLTKNAHDQIFNFSEGLACYAVGDKWGYINEAGNVHIPAKYDLIWDFKDGRARVVTKGGIGFIDPDGKLVIPPIFSEVKDFDEGLARVQIYRG